MLRKIRALKHSPVAATLIGLVAPVAWAMNVPIMRAIVEGFGMAPGECLLYAMATVIVALSLRIPDVKAADKRYLVFGIGSELLVRSVWCLRSTFQSVAHKRLKSGW